MNAERERELALRLREWGTVEECAKDLARRYEGFITLEDLISLGNPAAVKVVRTHDEELSSLKAHARFRIKRAMLEGIRVEARKKRIDRAAMLAQADLLALYRADPRATPKERMRALAQAVAAATFLAMTQEAQRGGEEDMVAREEYATAMSVIAAALAALPAPLRKLCVLVYVDGLSLTDAQEKLKKSYKTMLRWHDTVLATLKARLEQHEITARPGRGGAPRVAVLEAWRDKPKR